MAFNARRFEFGWLPVTALALILVGLTGLGLAGCSDDAPPSSERKLLEHKPVGPQTAKWLDLGSSITSAQWLASRGEDRPRAVSDPEVQRIAQLLSAAQKRFPETARIIANRAVQVEDALRARGSNETATRIIEDLTGISGDVGYGEMCRYYLAHRTNGLSHADAIVALKAKYGARS